ncbi:MAG: NAD(P)/FAD-dependent oxidoreductase, partial [Candidatus Methanofastidiosia archaeon]
LIEEIMYDAKFRLYTKTYDDMVRTFCTNPCGFVTVERHKEYVLVNGDARKNERTENTNLALLSRVELTDPVEDTTEYGRSIARLANVIGGGKPIIQRYKDLVRGKRSTWKRISRALITPSLKEVTPGDIAMALPNRIVKNIIEAIQRLDSVIGGIASDSTLLYAPEIKFYDTTYVVSKNMETKLENFYVAGDASGHSRGIVYSAVTGMLTARGILKKEGV